MNKKEVQKRVLQNGEPLALSRFSWDEETRTFPSKENNLVIDFKGINYCSVKTGSNSTVKTGLHSTVITGWGSTVTTGWESTVITGLDSTVTTGSYSIVKTGSDSTVRTGWDSTVKTGWDSTITAGAESTVTTGSRSTVICKGENIVIVNRNVFEVIKPKEGQTIQICPYKIPGHLVDGMYNGEPHIIVDGILSKVISHKGNVYKVINHGEKKQSFIVQKGNLYSHGETLKEAKEGLKYKFEKRDLSAYEGLTLESTVSHDEAMQMYHDITGACSSGTRYFVEQNSDKIKDKYTVAEIIKITEGQYKSNKFKEFFEI